MEKIFLGIVIFAIIFILLLTFFIIRVSSNVTENARELRTTLEKVQAPIYSPLGIVVSFFKFLLSFFS